MISFIIKKVIYGTLVLWGVLTTVFFLFNVLPGDPARMMLDKREDANQLAVIKQKYAFDRSVGEQYALYLNDVLPLSIHHNSTTAFTSLMSGKYQYSELFSIADYTLVFKVPYLRESFVRKGTSVTSILGNTFKNTFVLALSSIGIALFLGLILGAEILIRGAVNLAHIFKVSPFIIGVVIVAGGTSLPELAASLQSISLGFEDIVIGIAILLCLSVVLIIGNTIRLAILNQKDAIAVMKLVGATDSFIQRPFLYSGVWYGILGGLVAVFCVAILAQYFTGALIKLTDLYQSNFQLIGLNFTEMLMLISFAVFLGLIGSYISVRKHIKAIEPTAD